MWNEYKQGFKQFLQIEKGLSDNSISAYLTDLDKLIYYIESETSISDLTKIKLETMENFLACLNDLGLGAYTQARIISGIKSFFHFLMLENIMHDNPMELIELPKLKRKLPDVLNQDEIDAIINAVDLSHPQGHRNKAIIEILYSSGLRVSELINIKLNDIFWEEKFIRIIGKGNKERLTPTSSIALDSLKTYIKEVRSKQEINKEYESYVFLNRRGKAISRIMIFNVIKTHTELAGLSKKVSPHTFRHSFATHLIEAGADLRLVQQMLGHESVITTEIYMHLDKTYLQEELSKFHPRMQDKTSA